MRVPFKSKKGAALWAHPLLKILRTIPSPHECRFDHEEDLNLPLYENAVSLIRANLEAISDGKRARLVIIGTLTDVQRDGINAHRSKSNPLLQPIVNEGV
jgi:hypothetical protein